MKTSYFFSFVLSFFFLTIATAQSDNKLKILGCWEVRQVIFTKEVEGSDEISMEALGTIVCFEKDGKFINKRGETVAKGNYKLSENGRTLYQNSESDTPAPSNHIVEDIPGQIMMLSDTELQIQAEEMILYFRKDFEQR
jgi:hypothetical protein